ncbi:MAG: hypothetical protein NUK62_06540 [Tenericutes bacterium]|nr:hypothetical protein [Mycoplasmatota bacterium]
MTGKEYNIIISDMKNKVINKTEFYNFEIYEIIFNENNVMLDVLIDYRTKTMSDKDFKNKFILATDSFSSYTSTDRLIIQRIIFDIESYGETERRMNEYKQWFKLNFKEEKLFKEYKQLEKFIRKNDDEGLIEFNKIKSEYVNGNHFKHNKNYYKSVIKDQVFEQLLRPDTLNVTEYPFYIKLDNEYYSPSRNALSSLEEAAINPSNPKWTESFSIHNGLFEGASYELREDNDDEMDIGKKCFKDNDYLRGIRRIESIAKRKNNGRFSMMIEELSIEYGILVGRCIHLDSQDPIGTNFFEAILSHIDYAINVYGEIHNRLNIRMDKKEKYDASLRGHLFRIENYPFYKLPDLTYLLFKSKLLTEDWATATFNKVKYRQT